MIQALDHRAARLEAWVRARLDCPVSWSVVSADASSRRYFRAQARACSWIAVDSPPESQNNQAFVDIAALFRGAGLNVPTVLACDLDAGFLLLSDLGEQRFIDVLNADNADDLFASAIAALVDWQAASRPEVLPAYDRATLWREIRLFDQWYLPRVLGHVPGPEEQQALEAAYTFIIDRMAAQPSVFVHRDYMPRNLMMAASLPGIIDFQDARYGPASYDVASLFRDAFISWPEDRISTWMHAYWQAARARHVPVADDWRTFVDDVALTGAQRHLKIMGLFVRLAEQQNKPAYAADLGRFARYLAPVVHAHAALAPLRAPIDAAVARHAGRS